MCQLNNVNKEWHIAFLFHATVFSKINYATFKASLAQEYVDAIIACYSL